MNEKFIIGKEMYKRDERDGFDEFQQNMLIWKKEFTSKDIHDAFIKAMEGTPFEEDALMNLAMMLFEAEVISKLYPRDEYDKKFKKGEE